MNDPDRIAALLRRARCGAALSSRELVTRAATSRSAILADEKARKTPGRPSWVACHDLAVFKAFFNRMQDWADLEEMVAAGTIDLAVVAEVLIRFLGTEDERIPRLMQLESA